MNPGSVVIATLLLVGCERVTTPTASSPTTSFPNTIGASCEAVYAAELARNSRHPPLPPLAKPGNSVWFEGKHDGKDVVISYQCDASRIRSHYISATFLEEADAQRYLLRQKKDLESLLGKSCLVYDTLAAIDANRLSRQPAEDLQEMGNTSHWQLPGGAGVMIQISFDPQQGTWDVLQFVAPNGPKCSAA